MKGEKSLLSTVGRERGHLNISADDQKRLFVLESVFNKWTDVLLLFFL